MREGSHKKARQPTTIRGNAMKKVTLIGFCLLAATIFSCRQNATRSDGQTPKANETVQKANMYLQALLHIGDSQSNVIQRFGFPSYEYEAHGHELRMYFYFSDTNHEALAKGVGGFTGFFNSNQLTRWEPIYIR